MANEMRLGELEGQFPVDKAQFFFLRFSLTHFADCRMGMSALPM
jgi:hypothetical protein